MFLVFVLYSVPLSVHRCLTGPPYGCWEICDTESKAAADGTDRKGRYLVRNGQEVREIGGPSWNFDAVSSKPAPLLPYQRARPALLIEPAGSQTLAEIDCVAVSITSSTTAFPSPPLPPLLSDSLAQTPAGYLFVMGFFHLSLSSSSLQPQSVCVKGSLFHSLRIYGLLTWCLSKQAARRGQKTLLHAALSSLNHIQISHIFFLN